MKALVTGGAGFLGSHLVDALVERGDNVTVLDNLKRGSLRNLGSHAAGGKITLLVGDVRDYDRVLEATAGVEIVYHLAAQSNVMGAAQDLDYSFTTNVIGTFNVLKAASKASARRVVFASSREVYGEPESLPVSESAPLLAKNPYGSSKVAAEAYCRVWRTVERLECQVLRFANLYGPRDRDRVIPLWIERACQGNVLELYGGEQVLDFLHVSYAVAALLASANCPEVGPINVGSGTGTPLVDLAERVLDLVGRRSVIQRLPGRPAEVVRFVADVKTMRCVLSVEPNDDPLYHLRSLLPAC